MASNPSSKKSATPKSATPMKRIKPMKGGKVRRVPAKPGGSYVKKRGS